MPAAHPGVEILRDRPSGYPSRLEQGRIDTVDELKHARRVDLSLAQGKTLRTSPVTRAEQQLARMIGGGRLESDGHPEQLKPVRVGNIELGDACKNGEKSLAHRRSWLGNNLAEAIQAITAHGR
jgi:hypothetical protein